MLYFCKYCFLNNTVVEFLNSTKCSHQFSNIFLVDFESIISQFLVNFLLKYLASQCSILFTVFLVNFQSIFNQIFSDLVVNFIHLTKSSHRFFSAKSSNQFFKHIFSQFFSQFLVNYQLIFSQFFNQIYSELVVNFLLLTKCSHCLLLKRPSHQLFLKNFFFKQC